MRCHPNRYSFAFFLVVILGLCSAKGNASEGNSEISIRVDIQGDIVRVDVELLIPATVKEVWDVLTDFEHLPRFISNIASSKVLSRDGNVVRIMQTGKTNFGPLTFEFRSEREMTLTPFEKFESRMISGNMKRFRGTTQLETSNGRTLIRYHAEAVPETMLPLGLGRSLIETETREHYEDIRSEVLRRKHH